MTEHKQQPSDLQVQDAKGQRKREAKRQQKQLQKRDWGQQVELGGRYAGVKPELRVVCYPKSGERWLSHAYVEYVTASYGADGRAGSTTDGEAARPAPEDSFFDFLLRNRTADRFCPVPHFTDEGALDWPYFAPRLPAKAPDSARLALLLRDPRDVLVSHFLHLVKQGRVEVAGKIALVPDDWGISEFVKSDFFGIRNMICFINLWAERVQAAGGFRCHYEDFVESPAERLRTFLADSGVNPVSDQATEYALSRTPFDRLLTVGGYGEYLRGSDIEYVEDVIEQHLNPSLQRYIYRTQATAARAKRNNQEFGWHRLLVEDEKLYLRGREADLRQRLKSLAHEPWTVMWAQCFLPSECVYDVGANIGCMSLFFACRVPEGRVYAFEPSQYAFGDLAANVNYNKLENVIPIRAGAAGHSGERLFNYSSVLAMAAGHHWDQKGGVFSESVSVFSLDDFAERHNPPQHIYIDTDGDEVEVLTGAERILRQCQSVMCEFESIESYHACEPYLNAAGLNRLATFAKRRNASPWFQALFVREAERFEPLRQLQPVEGQYAVEFAL